MTNKIALVTGASSGIGRATAMELSQNGFNLILCGRRRDKLEEVQKKLPDSIISIVLCFDVRSNKEVEENIHSLPEEWRNIDLLVNNAGNAHGLSSIDQGDLDDWDAMIDTNVKGLLYVSRAIMPLMVKKGKGHIVNISSIAGKQTYANGGVYCASKKSVEAISEGMRLDLTQHGIKITNIAPGAVETEFSEVRFKGNTEKAKKVYEGYDALQAKDIASVVVFAVMAPERMTIADITVYPKAQASPSLIYRDNNG